MIAILGGGRMGRALARALGESGERVELASGRAEGAAEAARFGAAASTVVLAVPDVAIATVATRLAADGAITAAHVVLHLSGLHDRDALRALAPSGAALGSLHPLQTIVSPDTAAARWRGAYAAVEGDPPAVREATRLAGLLGLHPVLLPPGAKPAYHAGAVIASNYLVTLAALASQLAVQAGIEPARAARLYLPLMRGALENLDTLAPEEALTGPVRRGDVATVRAHLDLLPEELRRVYTLLGLQTLQLAERAGLEPQRAGALRALLEGGTGQRAR